jgi:hypothetical protein
MPFVYPQLVACRPYLYHLTAVSNLPSIATTRQLRCASALLADAGIAHRSSVRRLEHVAVSANAGSTMLRDQKPLIEGAIAFETGWDLARLVQHVNQHVFFWPGRSTGPIEPGMNHFERYRSEGPAILRFATAAMSEESLRFSRYNSGAPRCSAGKYSPRGSATYLPAIEFRGTASEVVEVVAVGACMLPSSVEVSYNPAGPWQSLSTAAY